MTETVTIRAIAAGGDGVGTLADGRTVFVPRSASGDVVALTSIRRHSRFARARIGQLIEASPDRVSPPCPHYLADDCGGCQLMHLSAEAQLRAKATIAGDALRRIGGQEIVDPAITPSPAMLYYRSKMSLRVVNGVMGYHRVGDADRVFDVRTCHIVEPAVAEMHRAIRRVQHLLPVDVQQVVFRQDQHGKGHVVVRTPGGRAWTGGAKLHAASGLTATIWWHPADGVPRAVAGSDNPWPATVFEQVNPEMGRLVRAHALRALGDVSGKSAWDLYAGIGDTTRALAEGGAIVESIELDRRAVEVAEVIGPAGPKRHNGAVESMVTRLPRPDLIVTNPPRVGMAPEVCSAIVRSGAARVVYISCGPATLARDITRMQEAYRLTEVAAFDQFPQTAHLETVALLERKDR